MAPAAVLQFRVECSQTKPGEAVFVVGSSPELGAWKVENGVPCITTSQSFPVWSSPDVPIAAKSKVEFKIVIAHHDGQKARWEGGDNKVYTIDSEGTQMVIVRCAYNKKDVKAEASKLAGSTQPSTSAPAPTPTQSTEEKVSVKSIESMPKREISFGRKQNSSRHLIINEDKSTHIEMSRTPSLMLIDASELFDEAAKQEKKLDDLERERLNVNQRRMASGSLLAEMQKITSFADPSETIMLQGFNWESHKAGKGDWYKVVASKVDMFSSFGITDIWLPPCSASVAPQGYLPSQLFNLDGSKYGSKASLQELLKQMRSAGIRGMADIVINHRCGDQQDAQGRWNVFTSTGIEHRKSFVGVMDWQGWAVTLGDKFSDGTGEHGPGKYDGKFDAAPDIDHGNKKVQESIKIWMRWLRLEVGFDAWRFDFVKGYGAEYVGFYCKKTEPAWAVGELWLDMVYDDNGLAYNQDKHRQDTINWINAAGKESTAFDFTTKGILQEAVRNCQYWRLKDSNGKPPGLLGWMPTHAVTFLDNHDTGSTQAHWPFPNDKVLVGYAYILTHPGIPSIFWDHLCDWGDDVRNKIKELIRLRRESDIKVNAKVKILAADNDLYLAEVGEPAALRIALGPRGAGDADRSYWNEGAAGSCWRVWISKAAQERGKAKVAEQESAKKEARQFEAEALKAQKQEEEAAKARSQAQEEMHKAEEARKLEQFRQEEEARKKTAADAKAVADAKAAEEAKALAEAKAEADAKNKQETPAAALQFSPPSRPREASTISSTTEAACLRLRLSKGLDKPGVAVVACGDIPSLGNWNPASAMPLEKVDDLWVLHELPSGARAGTLFKYVVLAPGAPPKWEGIANRSWKPVEAPVVTNIFDSTSSERTPKLPGQTKKFGVGHASAGEFIGKLIKENEERVSYRLKLELPKMLLESQQISSLTELACLQAYLTFIASGQITCKEDGRHNRPCAAANAAKFVTEELWEIAKCGDAECFIARRIFPSLPSFSDEFTCAVPMTRIRDIAHRNDIPKDMKLYIKHELQNKLHRCADPGDLVKLDKLIERIDREGGYSESFVKEMKIFQIELRDFFNAAGLDDSARQIAAEDASVREPVDRLLGAKHNHADPFDQLNALTNLRRAVAPKVESEQNWLRLDVELEKYAFVLLSQIALALESGDRGSEGWWQRLLRVLVLSLAQIELSGLSPEECANVANEVNAVSTDVSNPSKAPFAPQRLAASSDRALRICFALQASLEQAYASVPDLGKALNIDAHAVSVFVEAELRASVLFQVSKLAQLALQQSKVSAGLPLWTTISAGIGYGRCMLCASLSESWSKQLPPEGVVIFCDEANGDEEIPNLVRGVVVGRDLPVLSHLALRARQLGTVFACTSEGPLYSKLRSEVKAGSGVKLVVEASGGVRVEVVSDSELNSKKQQGKDASPNVPSEAPQLGALSLEGNTVMNAIDIADKSHIAGGKAASSGKLEKLAKDVGFLAPKGLAIPFGVMKNAVKGAAFDAAVASLKSALDGSKDIETKARAVRDAVEKCEVPANILDGIIAGLPNAQRVAVRSSANSEDLEKVSGAGLHDSVLGVDIKDRSSLQKAILQVWSSMFTLRAVQSRHAAGMPLYDGIAMGVLVQPMASRVGRCYAFIAFSKDAVANNDNAVYMEICVGLGETLASANEPGTPYRLVVAKDASGSVKIQSLASFSYGLQDMPGGPKQVRIDYSKERLSNDETYLRGVAQDIAKIAVGVEKGYGLPMDMEGIVLEQDGGREIHLVQARPIVGA
eukprot:TRINITY_DN3366_c0_g6_i1.p1 TRINITY_DN3366_c0_g6~~TRINITY_DN3366_c0_g6_i1.p1  ORF type:complete len:1786 (+),score=300.32 TRINITY_DN3366_c0_g6_i1:41-5359(+)